HCGVFKTHIHDFGAGGVRIGETTIPRRPEDRTSHVTVDNCIIHDGGHIFPCAVGVWIGHSPDNRVTHNEIADLYYSGISVGWRWGYGESLAKRNLILFNHIHHIGYGLLSDMGAVYTLGPSAGTKVNNNVIHDVYAYSYGGWGLYTDEGSSDIEMANNLVYHTKSGSFHQHYGRDNLIRNNIFAFNQLCQVKITRSEPHRSIIFQNNIVIYDTGELFQGPMHRVKLTIDHNLYWNAGGRPVRFAGKTFAEWKKMGRDLSSRIADPMFMNARALDFRLTPDSPALKLGFKPFEYSQAGVYGDENWKHLAHTIPVKQLRKSPKPPDIPLKDDFERRSPGNLPRFATIENEGHEQAIAISADTAASGRQSLRIEDGPAFRKPFNPHLFYTPKFKRGTASVSFDLRVAPDADVSIEWRDYADGGFRVGPRLQIAGGRLQFSGKTVELPPGRWIHFEISAHLGAVAGNWDLTLAVPGEKLRHFAKLNNTHSSFRELDWIGFISNAKHKTVFYLDNIEIRAE
ncbi:MAG: right-handed parallel beta-helix repeat-containing protein, partial [Lentisphaerae bacterium]